MAQAEDFGAELADFRRRVEELRSARALPDSDRLPALDAALFELQHVAEMLWPRYEELAAAERHHGGRDDHREHQLLRALFQRLPVAVALLDRDGVVRRFNSAATRLFGVRAGYATGRALTGSLSHDSRAAFRSQVAAVARDEGDRSLVVHLLRPPEQTDHRAGGELRATLTALRPPREPRAAVLAVFQPGAAGTPVTASPCAPGAERGTSRPDLAEVTRTAELMDLLEETATALITADSPKDVPQRAAEVLYGRFADWVIVDVVDVAEPGGGLRRAAVLAPGGRVRDAVAEQDPASCPLVVDAVRHGAEALRVHPEDPEALGRDATGAPVLVRAEVSSLLCVPLAAGRGGPVLGALTLLRTRGRRAFELAEASAVDRIARHIALALRGL